MAIFAKCKQQNHRKAVFALFDLAVLTNFTTFATNYKISVTTRNHIAVAMPQLTERIILTKIKKTSSLCLQKKYTFSAEPN